MDSSTDATMTSPHHAMKYAEKVENQDEIQDRPTLFMRNMISIKEL